MADSRRIDNSTLINEERLICANCRGQFSFCYNGKKEFEPDQPGDLMRMTTEDFIGSRKERYRDLWEAYEPCPDCGYIQDWMVRIRKRMLRLAVVAGSVLTGTILLLGLQYLNHAGVLKVGALGIIPPIVTVLAAVAVGFLRIRCWNPNRRVNVQAYGGAARVSDVEPPAHWNAEICLSLVPYSRPRPRMLTPVSATLGIVLFTLGLAVFTTPLLSEEAAVYFTFVRPELVMVPFFAGIALMILGPALPAAQMIRRYRTGRNRPPTTKVQLNTSSAKAQSEEFFKERPISSPSGVPAGRRREKKRNTVDVGGK